MLPTLPVAPVLTAPATRLNANDAASKPAARGHDALAAVHLTSRRDITANAFQTQTSMNPSESRQWTESRQWAERSKWLKRNQKVTPQPLKPVERRPSLQSNTSSTSQSEGMDIPGGQRRMSESSMASSQGSSMGTSPTTELMNMMSGMKNANNQQMGQMGMNPLRPPRSSRFSNSDMHMSF